MRLSRIWIADHTAALEGMQTQQSKHMYWLKKRYVMVKSVVNQIVNTNTTTTTVKVCMGD